MGTIPRDPIFFPRMKFRARKRIMREHFDHVHFAPPPKYNNGGILEPGEWVFSLAGCANAASDSFRTLAIAMSRFHLVLEPKAQTVGPEFFDDFDTSGRVEPDSTHESWKQ